MPAESIARPGAFGVSSCFDLGSVDQIRLPISPSTGEKLWLRGCVFRTSRRV